MKNQTITVHPASDGSPTVRWELDSESADAVLTLLARAAMADPSPENSALLDNLALAINEAADLSGLSNFDGCPGLWPDAPPMPLDEPALLRNETGTLLSVLLPGDIPMLEAVPQALAAAREHGADLDSTDENLMADYHPARWMVLNVCESTSHDFHPELAALGARTHGAIRATRVDFTHA